MNTEPRFTKKEEFANALSHGFGLVLAIVATVILIVISVASNSIWHILGASVFGATLILLYFSSTMNHSLKHGRAKDFFHNFDQIAIYLLIAGTYTPIALSIISFKWAWTMLAIEWGIAISGLLVKALVPNKFERGVNTFVIISYVIMGWLLVFFLVPLFENLPLLSIVLIFAGGLFYSLGIIFFKMERIKYSHLIWHLMVIGGSICHWIAIFINIANQ